MAKKTALANNIIQRRSSMTQVDACSYKSRWAPSLDDPAETSKLAVILSNDVSIALGGELDDLETGHSFRAALQRVFVRVLRMGREHEEAVLFFNEAVPGYTMMLLKKGSEIAPAAPAKKARSTVGTAPASFDPSTARLDATPEGQAASLMIEAFFERTRSRAMTIEHPDALFVFFPATDLRKNVRDMGFYSVEE